MQKEDTRDKATYRALFVLNLLSCAEYDRNQLIEELHKLDYKISKTTISNYIEQLILHGIPILKRKVKGKYFYSIDKKKIYSDFSEPELSLSDSLKKLLIAEKDYRSLRKAIIIYYKFALKTSNIDSRKELADFGYFSTLNWRLVNELEIHCREKNLIKLEYMLPQGEFKDINFIADRIKVGDWTNRLYLSGVFSGAQKISNLPIDRICMVKETLKKHERLDFEAPILVYKVKKQAYQSMPEQKSELVSFDKDIAIIKRPLDDFNIAQRLLHFCPHLLYISDNNLKKILEEKLNMLKELYNGKKS